MVHNNPKDKDNAKTGKKSVVGNKNGKAQKPHQQTEPNTKTPMQDTKNVKKPSVVKATRSSSRCTSSHTKVSATKV